MSGTVVVTGRGLICSLGDDPASVHAALCEGRSGLGPVELFETKPLTRPVAGEIKGFNAKTYLGNKNLRPLDRTSRLVTAAAHLALVDSGWSAEARSAHEVGLVLGTVYGSVRTIAEFDRRALEAGPMYASPMDFANTVINAAAGQAAIWHGLRGINSTLCAGQSSGLQAIAYAAGLIGSGRADVLLAGGAEELCIESFLSLERAGLVSLAEPDPVPFEAERRGFLPGEGAALLVLESAELAESRGARVLAEVRGAGTAFDPALGQDEGQALRAAELALRSALSGAGFGPDDIGALSVSANGGSLDDVQVKALSRVLGPRAGALPITAIKASLGETLGADGGLQAVVAIESLASGELPGIRGLRSLGPEFPFPLAGAQSRPLAGASVLLSSAGFDGHHCALVISKPAASR